jgi:hypothetical protein
MQRTMHFQLFLNKGDIYAIKASAIDNRTGKRREETSKVRQ